MKIKGPARSPEATTPAPVFGSYFYCHTCNPKANPLLAQNERMTTAEAKAHLREKHGLNASGGDFGGKRSLIVHGDAPSHSLWIFYWKIGEITLVEYLCTPRRPMR